MFMGASGRSLCDSRSASYFDRPTAHISRYRSDDSYRATTTSSSTAMTRKRSRPDSSRYDDFRTPRAAHTSSHDLDASISSFGFASPSPLVNTDYHISGGLDTPGAWSEQREERAQIEDAERDYRQNRWSEKPQISFYSDGSIIPKPREEDSNADLSASTTLSGWHLRRTAWALTGGLAGKIFNFCWNTTFRGFQAGGGQAYNINDTSDTDFAQDSQRPTSASRPLSRSDSSGYFPRHGTYVEDEKNRGRQNGGGGDHLHRPVKTPVSHSRYTTLEDSAVKNNWVFVETHPASPEEHSPVRKKSRASIAAAGGFNSGLYNNHIPPRTTTAISHTNASFASPRSRTTSFTSLSRAHSRSNSYNNSKANPVITISPKPKRPRISMPAGYNSPTKRPSTTQYAPYSSPEIETYHRKRRKEAKKHDESLARLNAQLQGMIREGQEALGSRVEVEYGGEGGSRSGFGYGYGDEGSGSGSGSEVSDDEQGYQEDMIGGRYLR